MLFGGNLLRQPAFVNLVKDNPQSLRVACEPNGSDQIMMNTLFLGTYPGLSASMLQHEISVISNYIDGISNNNDN